MGTDKNGAALHDKATRGSALSETERQRLDAWYAAQDAQEAAALGRQSRPAPQDGPPDQLMTALDHLQRMSRQMQELSAQNAALRQEIATLQEELARRSARNLCLRVLRRY